MTTKSDLMQQIDMNFVTAFLCCRASVNAMIPTGAGGRIVNVASRPALEWRAGAGLVAYTASKAAVAAMTVALAEEIVKEGILVNAIAPLTMDTPANRQAMPRADHAAWPKVEEVAATILFLKPSDRPRCNAGSFGQPNYNNAGEHDIACGHLSVQNLHKVVTRLDVPLYIHEEVAGRELVLQPLIHRLGNAGIIIASAVVDEDPAGHLPLPLWQAFSNT
jgi:hypothetical protein